MVSPTFSVPDHCWKCCIFFLYLGSFWLCVVSLIPPFFWGVSQKKKKGGRGGMCSCAERLNKDICFHLFCHHHRQHLARAEQTVTWIGVFVGRIKEMLSQVNEGRFTQYNDGWTHGFTADMHLKGSGKYSFRTEGFICRYTYPLQPPAPTWGPKLSSRSLLFLVVI